MKTTKRPMSEFQTTRSFNTYLIERKWFHAEVFFRLHIK